MKAILQTRCGCSREMSIPWPPNPEIIIPLRTDWSKCWFNEDQISSHVTQQVRRFTFVRAYGQQGPFGTAEYMEKA